MAGLLPHIPPVILPPSPPAGDGVVTIRFVLEDGTKVDCNSNPLLAIPKRQLFSFQLTTQNWLPLLRYIGFAVTNSAGILAREISPTVALTSNDLPWLYLPGQVAALVFTCQNPSCLADVNLLTGESVTHASVRDPGFSARVTARDDNQCPFTGAESLLCQAIHIVRRNKGDRYISLLSQLRGGTDIAEFDDIDDERNGLFVRYDLHLFTAVGRVAILKTPIADILETADVNPTVPPGLGWPMYTLHYLGLDIYDPNNIRKIQIPPNLSTHIPNPTASNTPPDFLFTACYGCIALRTWGPSVNEVKTVFTGLTRWYEEDGGGDGLIRRGEFSREEKEAKKKAEEKQEENNLARSDRAKRGRSGTDFLPSYTEDGQLVFPGSAEIEALSDEEIYQLYYLYLSLPRSIKPRLAPTPSIDSGLQQRIMTWRKDVGVV